MAGKVNSKKGRKIGRSGRKPSHVRYSNSNRRFKNKLKRIRQSSGEEAALEYMRVFGVSGNPSAS